ncbi:S24/S26 family peptidase [Nocardioides hungaricus]
MRDYAGVQVSVSASDGAVLIRPALVLACAAVGAWVLRKLVIQATVEGESMQPTLHSGDRVFGTPMCRPAPGNIVLLRNTWSRGPQLLVKRVESVTSNDALVVSGDNAGSLGSDRLGAIPRSHVRGTVFAAVVRDNNGSSSWALISRRTPVWRDSVL